MVCSDPKPMKKAGSGMTSLSFGGEDYLLVIGGLGSVPFSPLSTRSFFKFFIYFSHK